MSWTRMVAVEIVGTGEIQKAEPKESADVGWEASKIIPKSLVLTNIWVNFYNSPGPVQVVPLFHLNQSILQGRHY